MREQNRDPDIMESSNLTDAEFKTLVIKMPNELLGSVENSDRDKNGDADCRMESV